MQDSVGLLAAPLLAVGALIPSKAGGPLLF